MFPIVVRPDAPFVREELVAYLEQENIETRPMLPLLNQPVCLKLFGDIESEYPVAQGINRRGFYIGCHHGMQDEDVDYVIDRVAAFIRNQSK